MVRFCVYLKHIWETEGEGKGKVKGNSEVSGLSNWKGEVVIK